MCAATNYAEGARSMNYHLFLELLFICLAGHALAGCRDDIHIQIDVNSGKYTAPEISSVVAGTATNLARATVQHGDDLVDGMHSIIGGTLGLLPGGAFISGMFSALGSIIGGGKDPTEVLAEMYNSLVAEIENLRLYVDDRIEQTNVEWITNQLGDAHGGLMSHATAMADETDLEELEDQLGDLYRDLKTFYYHFAPRDDTVASYERTLPLFRQYADLFVTTLVSEIAVLARLNKTSDATDKVTALQTRIDLFEAHYDRALEAIIYDHITLESYECCKSTVWEGWAAFATQSFYRGECTTSLDGVPSLTKYEIGCEAEIEGGAGQNTALSYAKSAMVNARWNFVANRTADLTAYWTKEVDDAMGKWTAVSDSATQIQQAHLM